MSQFQIAQPFILNAQSVRFEYKNEIINKEQKEKGFQCPPDIQKAKIHGQANKIARPIPKNQQTSRCQCCKLPIQQKQIIIQSSIPFSCQLKQLVHLGLAFPLYFDYIKLCFYLIMAHITISGMFILLTNSLGQMCENLNDNSFICKWSVLNVLNTNKSSLIKLQNLMNVFFILVSIVIIQAFKIRQKILRVDLSNEELAASNYTVLVKGLPAHTNISQVQNFIYHQLQQLNIQQNYKKIVKIYMIYNIRVYNEYYQKKVQLYQKKYPLQQKLQKYKFKMAQSLGHQNNLQFKISFLQHQLNKINYQLIQTNKQLNTFQSFFQLTAFKINNHLTLQNNVDQLKFSGKSLITFNSQQAAKYIIQKWKMKWKQKAFVKKKICYCCLPSSLVSKFFYHGNFLRISRVSEPSDILWANIGSHKQIIGLYRFITGISIIIALILDFIILTTIKKCIKINQDTSASSLWNISLSLLSSIICCGFNTLLGIIIRYLVKQQIYSRKSKEFERVCKRLTCVFMLNMVFATFFSNIVSFFLHDNSERTYPHFPLNFQGLINDFFFLFITNSYMSSVFNYFDIMWAWRMWKRWKIQKGQCVMQKHANLIFEGHPVDMALRYANVKKTMLFTGAVSPLLPIGLPLSLLALAICYVVDKYLLVNRYVSHYKLDYSLSKKMIKMLKWYPILFSLTNILIMFIPMSESQIFNHKFKINSYYDSAFFYLSILAFIFAVVYPILPSKIVYNLFKYIFRDALRYQKKNVKFQNIEEKLTQDYSDFYPYFRVESNSDKREYSHVMVKRVKKSLLDKVKSYLQNRMFF